MREERGIEYNPNRRYVDRFVILFFVLCGRYDGVGHTSAFGPWVEFKARRAEEYVFAVPGFVAHVLMYTNAVAPTIPVTLQDCRL